MHNEIIDASDALWQFAMWNFTNCYIRNKYTPFANRNDVLELSKRDFKVIDDANFRDLYWWWHCQGHWLLLYILINYPLIQHLILVSSTLLISRMNCGDIEFPSYTAPWWWWCLYLKGVRCLICISYLCQLYWEFLCLMSCHPSWVI